jgi:hypothetical protein
MKFVHQVLLLLRNFDRIEHYRRRCLWGSHAGGGLIFVRVFISTQNLLVVIVLRKRELPRIKVRNNALQHGLQKTGRVRLCLRGEASL